MPWSLWFQSLAARRGKAEIEARTLRPAIRRVSAPVVRVSAPVVYESKANLSPMPIRRRVPLIRTLNESGCRGRLIRAVHR